MQKVVPPGTNIKRNSSPRSTKILALVQDHIDGLTGQHLVEDVVVSLVRRMGDDPRLLQEVLGHVGAGDDTSVELDLDVLPEPGGVVVAEGLGVAEAL